MLLAVIITTLGVALVLVGVKGFRPEGIQFSVDRVLTGKTGRIVGTICVILGTPLALFGLWLIVKIANRPR
jgi:hypothetical protein